MKRTVAGLFVAALLTAGGLAPVAAQTTDQDVTLEWLTWSFFRITSPGGTVILTNPWVTNPDSQISLDDVGEADIILVATGHRDEVGETVEIANQTGAQVITTHEMAGGLFNEQIPDEQLVRTQPGSTVEIEDVTIRVVDARHGTGGPNALYGGAALGFFITFEDGYTLYFSGSTDVTMDMALWGRLFQPDAAILYYPGGVRPGTVAEMVRLLSEDNDRLTTIIPHHHRLEPPAGQSPADLERAIQEAGLEASVLDPEPGEAYMLPM